ncbi:unnamed protein product [Nippostrongylus brasiliensis]|uniref:Cytochrome n=1 Tax=Nippostrongylus brasiliensis TaxID=27835 RepID=A0A0N4YGE7_NIPBR|nr:unnamed protein product [Nippostrongylus brasiliensis]
MYLMTSPELVSADIDVLRVVLVKNFENFMDRTNLLNVDPSDKKSLLANSLVSLKGSHWSTVRSQVAPAFSTGKIKQMVPIFSECSKICTALIDDYEIDGRPVPIKDVIIRLTLDMTSKCAFGYNFDVQHNPTSPFIEFAKKFSEFDLRSPEVALVVEDDGDRVRDEEIEFDLPLSTRGLAKEEIIGQAFMFVLAGFETTPATLHLAIYMLAVHSEIQKRCRDEVQRVCGFEEDITYEMLGQLKFIDDCLSETLRMYPPVVRTNRLCTKDTTVKGIQLRKGCIFTIPIRAIHYCEDYYPNPTVFDPDRWSSGISKINPITYLPFGYGPRNCIGMRVAQMQMKMALVHLLRRYEMRASEVLELPLKIDTVGSMRTVEELSVIFTRI